MKILFLMLLSSLCLLNAACSSNDDTDNSDPGQNEDEKPMVQENPTEGFTLGNLPLPEDMDRPPLGTDWEVKASHSDEFNYSGKDGEFTEKWKDTYFNAWKGPGLSEWTSDNSDVADGNLIISASRKPGTENVYCGVISSKETIKYPIYTEVRAKVANQVLSSNFWFLSPDDKREIDILEIYGGDRPDQTWFAARASTNTHVFLRDDDTNAILEDFNSQMHHTLPNEEPWRNDYHRFGVYWKDAFTLDYYYDGILVSETRKDDINDPEGLGIDRASYMIIDLEDHDWRSSPTNGNPQVRATDGELADESKNKYFVDYVRTYSPKEAFDGGLVKNGSFDDPELEAWYWKGDVVVHTDLDDNYGEAYTLQLGLSASLIQKIAVIKNTDYIVRAKTKNTTGSATLGILDSEEKKINTGNDWQDVSLNFNSGNRDIVYLVVENTGDSTVFVDALNVSPK